ncbi:MAG: PHP domain-containing protein [Eubacteriales bacterium]
MAEYRITNPYSTVDWHTWGHFKANLHTHSVVSDGKVDFKDMIEAYYTLGFDILAMTDHGCVNRGWNIKPQPVPLLSYNSIFKKPRYLTDARYLEITTGSDRDGRGMTDVPFGIELNAFVFSKSHVNSYFVDYGQNKLGRENDFETCIAAVDALGGLTHINHPGDWLCSAKDINIAKDPKNVEFFAEILRKYPSCLGIEVLNRADNATRHDRVFWDGLLKSVVSTGRNVWSFASSDAHSLIGIDTCFEVFMMPKNNVKNVRTAMENGTFFACGRYARNEIGESFAGTGDYPTVTSITVDDEAARITIQGQNYTEIQWVSDGEIVTVGNTVNLNDYKEKIGCYIRAQLIGPGGICFTQAFIVDNGNISAMVHDETFSNNTQPAFKLKARFHAIFKELLTRSILLFKKDQL